MRTFDFSPLYRSTVGFDRLFDLIDQVDRTDISAAWPPYNIEKMGDDAYRITLAVAGFGENEIELTQNGNTLLVSGQKAEQENGSQVLHRGIATRHFRQTFSLADHVKVTNANLENGLLTVELVREVPEALKPRRISIGGQQTALGQDNATRRLSDEAKAA